MKSKLLILIGLLLLIHLNSCREEEKSPDVNIVFLHHSTGNVIWKGGKNVILAKAAKRINSRLSKIYEKNAALPQLFKKHNKEHKVKYAIKEIEFPKAYPYGWNNYPYDYYNIWVRNAGEKYFMEEPTLEILTKNYQVIIFKHCYPVSNIKPDTALADINSDIKSITNYKLQYSTLRDKLHEFPDTKFILFTGAAQAKSKITEDEAKRAREFFTWVTEEWDLPDDNIFIWDLYQLETEGGLYFRTEYATSSIDSHPNTSFARKAVKLLFNRIIDIIETNGNKTTLTGHRI